MCTIKDLGLNSQGFKAIEGFQLGMKQLKMSKTSGREKIAVAKQEESGKDNGYGERERETF